MPEPLDELRALLGSVEPSSTFEAKTRARIDHQRERARTAGITKRAWLFMIPMAAAAVVMVAVVLNPREDARRGGGLAEQSALREPAIAPPSGGLGNQSALAEPAVVAGRMAKLSVKRTRVAAAAWAIPENAHADQAIGMRRLMTLIRAKKIEVPGDSTVLDDGGPIPALAPVELKPIVIAPLPNGQGGGSER